MPITGELVCAYLGEQLPQVFKRDVLFLSVQIDFLDYIHSHHQGQVIQEKPSLKGLVVPEIAVVVVHCIPIRLEILLDCLALLVDRIHLMGIELLAVRLYRQGSHFGGVTVLEGVLGGDKGGKRLVADPWLITTAAVYGYTIVTFEKFVNVNTSNPSGTPKIPNIAEKFHVRTTDLFHMIRDLGVRL